MVFRILKNATWRVFRPIFCVFLFVVRSICVLICSWMKFRKPVRLPAITNELLLQPAHQLAANIRSRKITSEEVVRAYILRIQEVNPILNSVVDFRFKQAIAEAKTVDQKIMSGWLTRERMEQKTPFLGVPVTFKESIAVQGLRQTVGLKVRKDVKAEKDAEVVRLMREAGAIVIGVTNLPELSASLDTNNTVYGQTKNPYDTRRSPGGSSGGEASIIAAAGSVVGVGTDIVGSVRIPTMMCGIFGHKPTEGSTSQEGVVPILTGEFRRLCSLGPLTRYATDLRMMMSVLTNSHVMRQKLQQRVDIKNLRVFYIDDPTDTAFVIPVHSDIWTAQQKVIQYLRQTHGIEAQKFSFPEISQMYPAALCLAHQHTVDPYCEEIMDRKRRVNLCWEILKSMYFCSNHTFTSLVTCIGEVYINHFMADLYDAEVAAFLEKVAFRCTELLADDVVLLLPTFPVTAWHYEINIFYEGGFSYCGLANFLGVPATQFPVELNKHGGLPVGLQVIAGKNNDHLCLAFAEEMEIAFGGWVAPPAAESEGKEAPL